MSKQANLLKAILENNPGKVGKLLKPGFMGMIKPADINSPLEEEYPGWTPLMAAAEKGSREIIEILLEHGADVNAADKKSETPLSIALKKGEGDRQDSTSPRAYSNSATALRIAFVIPGSASLWPAFSTIINFDFGRS
jgi:ankyrin repeat protein